MSRPSAGVLAPLPGLLVLNVSGAPRLGGASRGTELIAASRGRGETSADAVAMGCLMYSSLMTGGGSVQKLPGGEDGRATFETDRSTG